MEISFPPEIQAVIKELPKLASVQKLLQKKLILS